jgi:hypothetical protein
VTDPDHVLRRLYAEVPRSEEAHPTEDALARMLKGDLEPALREATLDHVGRCAECAQLLQHVARCGECTEELQIHPLAEPPGSLWSRERARPLGWVLLVAASLAMVAIAWALFPSALQAPSTAERAGPSALPRDDAARGPAQAPPLATVRDHGRAVTLTAEGILEGLPPLPGDLVRASAQALRTGALRVPAALGDLAGAVSSLRGPADLPAGFRVVSPVATVVRTERPAFRWAVHPRAQAYVVTVFDDDLQKAADSGEIKGTQWTPLSSLRRGRDYRWQVAALTGEGREVSPAAPLPEARFQVLAADRARLLEERLRDASSSWLASAVVLAEAGVLDEAADQLGALQEENPGSAEVGRLLNGLQRARKPAGPPPS